MAQHSEQVQADTATAGRTALVAGATGLVGREVLAALLADKRYRKVHCIARRPLGLAHAKLSEQVVDFAALGTLPRVDDVFIALGTTIKVAGSQAAFRAVDLEAVVSVASHARAAGATALAVVSAMGANARSAVFYNRTKGEMEEALQTLDYPRLLIARPSMLAGDRESLDQASRSGEKIALVATRFLNPLIPKNYQSIAAADVAHALVSGLAHAQPGTTVLLSGAMQGAAQRI